MDDLTGKPGLTFGAMIGSASAYAAAALALVLAALAPMPRGAAGRRLARGASAPIVVRVDASAPLEELDAALEPLCGPGDDECVFVFGHAALSLPRTSVRIEWDRGPGVEGFIVRGKGLHERLLADAHASQWAMLMWADGELWLTHPSGPGRGRLPDEPVDLAVDFFAKDDGQLGALLPAFARAGDVLPLVIVWLRSDSAR